MVGDNLAAICTERGKVSIEGRDIAWIEGFHPVDILQTEGAVIEVRAIHDVLHPVLDQSCLGTQTSNGESARTLK